MRCALGSPDAHAVGTSISSPAVLPPVARLPADVAGLAQLLDGQLATLEREAAAAATEPTANGAAAATAADGGASESVTHHPLLPAARSMRSTLQVLTASLASVAGDASANATAIATATAQLQDAACGTRGGTCRDSASAIDGNEAGCQTDAALHNTSAAVSQPGAAAACIGQNAQPLQQPQASNAVEAATGRAEKWKARCSELRRALAASREAAALCSSLKVQC